MKELAELVDTAEPLSFDRTAGNRINSSFTISFTMHEILFPVLTGLSLVFAGILVGYFLWFRDRNEQIALCQQLTVDRERLTSESHELRRRLTDQEEQLDRRAAKSVSMQQLCDDLLASREKTHKHAGELENELFSVRRKLDQAREQLAVENQSRAQSAASLFAAKRNLDESLIKSDSEWREKLAEAESRAAHFKAECHRMTEAQQRTAELLQQANAVVAGLKSDLSAQEQNLEAAKTNASGLELEHFSLKTELRSNQQQINDARGQIAAAESARKMADEALAQSRQHGATMEATLTAVQKRSENQESTIGALRSQLAAITAQSNQKLAEQDSESHSKSQEWRTRLDSLLRQRDNAFDQIRSLTDELSQIKKHMRSNEETIRNLRRERGAVLLRNRQMTESFPRIHFAPAAEPTPSEQLAQEYGGITRVDSIRGMVFVETPRVQDDLKLVHGVGEVLEQRLNDFGIYTFKQIMLWDERAIDKFSELLIFKDRIRRDDWPGQARRLYHQSTRGAA